MTTERNVGPIDVLLGVGLTLLALGNLLTTIPFLSTSSSAERRLADTEALAISLVLVGTLCLIWRRQAPLTVLGLSTAAYCASLALGYPPTEPVAPVIALYTLAVANSSLVTATAGTVAGLLVAVATATNKGWRDDYDDRVVENLVLLLTAWMLGYGIQLSRARRSVLLAQESRLAREHAVEKQEALMEEKSRIARELHDVVAHHVSIITAQAAGAQRIFDTEPELAREALHSIETTGRGALTEMRRLLGVLQMEACQADTAPQPGLDQLPSLIAQMQRAGLPVELRVLGDPRTLSPGVELNAFRIIQEALTNTLKHAGPAHALIELSFHPTSLDLLICDNGCGLGVPSTSGIGLIGMRQRAELLGGELLVGTGEPGGVQVRATLPTEAYLP